MSDEVAACSEIMERLFYRLDGPYRGYTPIGTPDVVVPGMLFRAVMHREGDAGDRREVTVFRGIQGFASELWERSARTLIRLRSLRHPGLPVIRDAKTVRELQVAFTMTEQQGTPVDPAWLGSWAREHPVRAFEQFTVLLDALRQLHGARILHRGLTPGAFRRQQTGLTGADEQFSLAGFEMSMLIGNLVRRVARTDISEVRDTVRAVYLATQPSDGAPGLITRARHICYLPPETHEFLFEGSAHSRRDWESTDVFGLGMFGWELFCGPLAETLSGEFGLVAEASEGPATVKALAGLHGAMRDHLRQKDELPKAVREAVLHMIDHRPDGRRTTFDLAVDLENAWDTVKSSWETWDGRPYQVAVMPKRSVETMYENRSWLAYSPDTPLGRDELLRFMHRELSEASLVRSLNGARGYATGPDDKLAGAEWVLIGRRAVWFCEFIRDTDGDPKDEILLVKYFTEHELASELYEAMPRRRIPEIKVMSFHDNQSVGHLTATLPNWRLLTDSLSRTGGFNAEDLDFLQTMDFLLKYQRIVMEARVYPYEKVEQDGLWVVVRLDRNREDYWQHRSHLVTAYMSDPARRPRLGDFLKSQDPGSQDSDSQDSDKDQSEVTVELDNRITYPAFGRGRIEAAFEERLDPDTVRLRLHQPTQVSDHGWLRLKDDAGTQAQQRREIKARQALQSLPGLVQTLRSPQAFELTRHRWELPKEVRDNLRGNAQQIIMNILATEPFYALQGPPGSGKTTAVAHAVRLYLEQMRGARVLVSAQSNFALDNLAEALMERMPGELMLREVGKRDGERKVAPAVLKLLIGNVSADLVKQIKDDLDDRLPPPGAAEESDETRLLREWREVLTSARFELTDRIRNGASIVLATTSISALLLQRFRAVDDVFDWVIVEEAAKAWPTEIMIPLVLGTRWTLIGDHRQLGAHRSTDLDAFLRSLEGWEAEEVKAAYQARQDHLKWLGLFKSFFEHAEVSPGDATAALSASAEEGAATGSLDTLFRMHPKIAEPIRRIFYPREPRFREEDGFWASDLQADWGEPKEHGLIRPQDFVGHPLIWVDTEGMPRCRCKPLWSNDGEVELVERIVDLMRPEPEPPGATGKGSLAILTPYHDQQQKLARRGLLAKRVSTVHSFQGREADRVVVSLVRDVYVDDNPRNNVGLLAQEEVINVLLSRAKSLLVLVGNFAHFEEHAGPAWKLVTQVVTSYGYRMHAEELESA
jgi:hypothetical protein